MTQAMTTSHPDGQSHSAPTSLLHKLGEDQLLDIYDRLDLPAKAAMLSLDTALRTRLHLAPSIWREVNHELGSNDPSSELSFLLQQPTFLSRASIRMEPQPLIFGLSCPHANRHRYTLSHQIVRSFQHTRRLTHLDISTIPIPASRVAWLTNIRGLHTLHAQVHFPGDLERDVRDDFNISDYSLSILSKLPGLRALTIDADLPASFRIGRIRKDVHLCGLEHLTSLRFTLGCKMRPRFLLDLACLQELTLLITDYVPWPYIHHMLHFLPSVIRSISITARHFKPSENHNAGHISWPRLAARGFPELVTLHLVQSIPVYGDETIDMQDLLAISSLRHLTLAMDRPQGRDASIMAAVNGRMTVP